MAPVVASNANTWPCGEVTYITPPMMIGWLSNEVLAFMTFVWRIHTGCNDATLERLI